MDDRIVAMVGNADTPIAEQVPLAPYTTLGIGGGAEYFVEARTLTELRRAVFWAGERGLPITILGGGSNVFAADEGVRGLVIHNVLRGKEHREAGDEIFFSLGAGENFDDVVAHAVAHGWWGLENLSCIPGSVGATPIQNVGAYGVEVADVISSVDAYDMEHDALVSFTPAECAFGYRDSRFKKSEGKRFVITRVMYRLSKIPRPLLHYADLARWNEDRAADEAPTLAEIRSAVCAIREKKFPDWRTLGTAGSFFKNPVISQAHFDELRGRYPELPGYQTDDGQVKVALGWVFDRLLHLRGVREGTVGTYAGQALVFVNYGGASAHELSAFADAAAKKVFDATGIMIEREVTMLG